MKNNAFINKIREIQQRIPEIARRLPGIAKVEGLKFIADNFKNEGFEQKPGNYKKWPKRKGNKSKKKLVGEKHGGSLKRGWQQESQATGMRTEFSSSLPYAEVHNDGLQAGKPPGFTMPQSQMIGDSEALFDRINSKFEKMTEDVLK